jgi:hypothetical protein
VRAFGTDGQPIDERKMLDALKGKPKPVVVCTDPAGIDPVFAAVLKPGTLILVLPGADSDFAKLKRDRFNFWLGFVQ